MRACDLTALERRKSQMILLHINPQAKSIPRTLWSADLRGGNASFSALHSGDIGIL
jgi:hypothetical protein